MPDQVDVMRDTIQGELHGFAKHARAVWHEVSRKPVEPSPQQKFSDFMSLNQQERAQMVQQMGPEKYMEHVQSMIGIGERLIGPGAHNLEPYFMQDVQLQQQQMPENPSIESYDPNALSSLLDEQMGQMNAGRTG